MFVSMMRFLSTTIKKMEHLSNIKMASEITWRLERLVLCFNNLVLAGCHLSRGHMWSYFTVKLIKNGIIIFYIYLSQQEITWSGLFPLGQ